MSLISIIIPAFKNALFLEKLLFSISIQTFKDFEVVITDDSPDDILVPVIEKFNLKLPILYKKNSTPLGSPENWNEAIRLSKGEWIKIMHGDDWFETNDALEVFSKAININPKITFFYCACNDINITNGTIIRKNRSFFETTIIRHSIFNILFSQSIGNPSCTIFKRNKSIIFDKKFIWLVDVDFYIQYMLDNNRAKYISNNLVNVGISNEQITNACFNNPKIQVPESFLLIEKYGIGLLKNIFVYDYFWRLYRNLKLESIEDVEAYLGYKCNYPAIEKLIGAQQKAGNGKLKKGYLSKAYMLMAYFKNRTQGS